MPHRFMPISDEAPQSMRNEVRAARTWKQVLRRPPLPKASPQPTKVTSMDEQFPPPGGGLRSPCRFSSVAKPGCFDEPWESDNPQVARNRQATSASEDGGTEAVGGIVRRQAARACRRRRWSSSARTAASQTRAVDGTTGSERLRHPTSQFCALVRWRLM